MFVRIVLEKGYVRRIFVKVSMDREVFENIFGGVSYGRSRFDVMVEDFDIFFSYGWSERVFRISIKCVVCRE